MTAARLRAAFVAATIAWTCLLALAPYLATRAHASGLGTALVVAVYAVGSLICHQLPARSFHLWTAQLPVCARCTGIYLGAAAAAVAAVAQPDAGARAAVRHARRWLALAVAPTVATLVYEWTAGIAPGNGIRFAAGLPIGIAAAWLVVSASADQVNYSRADARVRARGPRRMNRRLEMARSVDSSEDRD
jgi:uncharacterized membrane protein